MPGAVGARCASQARAARPDHLGQVDLDAEVPADHEVRAIAAVVDKLDLRGLYFAAVAAQQLKHCTEARTYLDLVKKKYPKSNVTKVVNDLDAAIKKDVKNKAKCAS